MNFPQAQSILQIKLNRAPKGLASEMDCLGDSGIFLVFVPLNWILLSRNTSLSPAVLIGMSLLVSHLLGDLLSPSLIGEKQENEQ